MPQVFAFLEPSVQAMDGKRVSEILQRRQMISALQANRRNSTNSIEGIAQRQGGEASPFLIDE
jgi:hypothetical protein